MLMYLLLAILIPSTIAIGPSLIQLTDPVDHGEGPVWDERTGLVYFVDMFNGKLNSYNMATNELRYITLDGDFTFAVPSAYNANCFVIGLNSNIVEIQWNDDNEVDFYQVLSTVDMDKPRNRLNDAKADKKGRLWAGTIGHVIDGEIIDVDAGSLYVITNENISSPKVAVNPVNISNGMAWNLANDKFYFIDTTAAQVTEYKYDDQSAEISEPRVVFDISDFSDIITGQPDGMTIDDEDNLWIALYGGGAVVKFNPQEKQILEIIAIPAKYTTSVNWGGENYNMLFVTSSRYLLSEEERKEQPAAGSLFVLTNLNARGFASYRTTLTYSEHDLEKNLIK